MRVAQRVRTVEGNVGSSHTRGLAVVLTYQGSEEMFQAGKLRLQI